MSKIHRVSSSEFAGKFGHWSFAAQTGPVMVTDQKTGVVKGYFLSAREYLGLMRLRDQMPKAGFAWEMSEDMAAEIAKPLPKDYPPKKSRKKR